MKIITALDQKGIEHKAYKNDFLDRDAAYGVCILKNKILLVKDAKSKQWEIPGGGKEITETELECLKREFLEETGFIIDDEISLIKSDISYFFDLDSKEFWKTKRKYYQVKIKAGEIKINHSEISDVMFTKVKDALSLDTSPNVLDILKKDN